MANDLDHAPVPASLWAMLKDTFPLVVSRVREDRKGEHRKTADPVAYQVESLPGEPSAITPKISSAKGAVAVIPIRGVIVQHASGLWYGDTTTDWIGKAVGEMAANPNVGAIVLDVDSPGGVVLGVEETADKIRNLRASKPIYAVANSMAASAAYWIASSAGKFFVTPSGQVGSIGVWRAHVDVSKWEENVGFKTTLVSAGKYKVEGHSWAPLDEEARAAMQKGVDAYYERFVSGVAANRLEAGVTKAAVKRGFGEGRMVLSDEAKAEGMVDGVATLDDVLAALLKKNSQGGSRSNTASADILIAEANFR